MIAQVLANGLVTSSVYLLVAVAFVIVLRLRRFFDFSLAAVLVSSPYAAMALGSLGFPAWIAIAMGCLVAGAVCVAANTVVYGPLDRRGASSLEQLLASLGVYVILQNLISVGFGDDARNLGPGVYSTLDVLGARVTHLQTVTILVATVLAGALEVGASRTNLGLAVRAVGADRELARTVGVSVRRTTAAAVAVSGVLVGLAGAGLALDVAITPTGGLKPLLGGMVAVIVGGGETVRATACAALALGLLEHLSILVIGSLWKDAVVFIVLLLVLLVRPKGVEALVRRVG
jgi:branched-chain amino acid transport system permease protein